MYKIKSNAFEHKRELRGILMRFGKKIKGIEYRLREGSYGFLLNDAMNEVLLLKNSRGFFLPGGGVDCGECCEACLKREFEEETGMKVSIGTYITEGSLVDKTPKGEYLDMKGKFFEVISMDFDTDDYEDHRKVWVKLEDAAEVLHLEHQAWAANQYEEFVKKRKDKEMVWDRVAFRFGESGPDYWKRIGAKLVKNSRIKEGNSVLDVGTGRGAIAFPSALKVGQAGKVLGIDISEEMINENNKQRSKERILNLKFENMSIMSETLEEKSFDNVLCGFGLGYLLYEDRELNMIKRVLKKNGEFAFYQWGKQEEQQWLTDIIDKYLKPSNSEPRSDVKPIKFETKDELMSILENAGFMISRIIEEDIKVSYSCKEQWWMEMWSNAVRGIFEMILDKGEETFRLFKNEVDSALDKFEHDGSYEFKMRVNFGWTKGYEDNLSK